MPITNLNRLSQDRGFLSQVHQSPHVSFLSLTPSLKSFLWSSVFLICSPLTLHTQLSPMLLAFLPHSGIIDYHFSREHQLSFKNVSWISDITLYVSSKFLLNKKWTLCGGRKLGKVRKAIAKENSFRCVYLFILIKPSSLCF